MLAAAAGGLVLALGLAERRRTFAVATALGADPASSAASCWPRPRSCSWAACVLGAVTGWALSQMLVKVLTGVFDPPPSTSPSRGPTSASVLGVAVLAMVAAALAAIRLALQPPIQQLREL